MYYKFYKILIGSEIHIKLKEKKIFSNNLILSGYDLSIPGKLPLLNNNIFNILKKLCLNVYNCFFKYTLFERKMYFYYDLTKNYQITQNNFQIFFNIIIKNLCNCNIYIKKIHLEEDAASSNIEEKYINYNRSGNTLLEIVTEPVFNNLNCLIFFLKKIIYLFKNNNFSNCNLYLGEFRCDINISLINKINLKKTKKIEIKNLNSFNSIKNSLLYEFKRNIICLEKNIYLSKQTRNFYKKTNKIRKKCFSKEYNYDIDYDFRIKVFFDYDLFIFCKKKNIINNIFKKNLIYIKKKNIFKKKSFKNNIFLIFSFKNNLLKNKIINSFYIFFLFKKKILFYFFFIFKKKKKKIKKIKKIFSYFNF
ncbi:aspartyl/glutamyl-tRNA amidotransferase B subunit [Candidatus Carsonella ruddii CS isolate Thao2000]|uniref:Aspartyl/glutamyl-tRNA amidotransferase B subunit n=1 Tax=Candidatus Carsonella ruddii CS isolate Thao2000 TaxID=1202537 RepID=J7GSI5_CARRU|nr:aspartyl/glutamyl-tRNA amidotransferase B subunit [Candidatus Carsonella ruddii]AFP83712.1 aspartyl/glutamyl-tRNA amidotransferase B subunit [Candidatus Carsonella ruddii CS isolate Thao2000]